MADQQPLTDAQSNIVHNLQREVAQLMRSAEHALHAAGVPAFEDAELVGVAIDTVAEQGWRATFEALDLV